jgi:phospholipid transport system transporter-binding protein
MSVISLPAELDGDKAAAFLPALRSQLEGQSSGEWVLDAQGVQRFDSATLALLLECRRLAQARSQAFAVQGLPSGLQSMARVYGVDALLGLPAAATGAVEPA